MAARVPFSMDVPRRPDGVPLLPEALWRPLDPAVQAVLVALAGQVEALTAEVQELRARVGQTSANSSRPPSSDPPQARRPDRPPSGRARGGQPGHVASQRLVAPPERVDAIIHHRPQACAHCAAPLAADTPSAGFVAHQVTEVPLVRAVVSEHRLHRLVCSACGHLFSDIREGRGARVRRAPPAAGRRSAGALLVGTPGERARRGALTAVPRPAGTPPGDPPPPPPGGSWSS